MIHIKKRLLEPRTLERQAELFQAMASPARIVIMRILADGDRSVSELVEALEPFSGLGSMERTNVSKHLAVLREAGVVSIHEEGQKRIYHLSTPCMVEALDCVLDGACYPGGGAGCAKGSCDA